MKTLGIIPARYASTRFPGKPLAMIHNKPMIQHVYEKATSTLESVVVATDDNRIFEKVQSFGGNAILTSEHHQSGTDRCAEALINFETETNTKFDAIINIQGDEPFIAVEQIQQLNTILTNKKADLATLIKPIDNSEDLFNINKVKVVVDTNFSALYFSRHPIPFLRSANKEEWINKHKFYSHIGMYGYSRTALLAITQLQQGELEKCESLEQLRWLENGYKIITGITNIESVGIDTPEDLERCLKQNL